MPNHHAIAQPGAHAGVFAIIETAWPTTTVLTCAHQSRMKANENISPKPRAATCMQMTPL
jgi:hypothetical protein